MGLTQGFRSGVSTAPNPWLLRQRRGRVSAETDARHPATGAGKIMTAILPSVNAALNATSAILLTWGYTLIRRKQIDTHRKVMTAAFCTSCLFLVCYVVYHAQVGSVPFQKTG